MVDLQRTEEWFGDRLGKATASKFGVILAGPTTAGWKTYRTQLALERLMNNREQGFSSKAMDDGTRLEPLAVTAYEAHTGFITEETGFINHPTLLAGASPDRLVESNGLMEIKCPQENTHAETLRKGKMPPHHKAQVQGQLWIAAKEWNDFVSFNPKFNLNAQLFIERQYRDEGYIARLEMMVTKFLKEVEEEYNFIKEYQLKWSNQSTT